MGDHVGILSVVLYFWTPNSVTLLPLCPTTLPLLRLHFITQQSHHSQRMNPLSSLIHFLHTPQHTRTHVTPQHTTHWSWLVSGTIVCFGTGGSIDWRRIHSGLSHCVGRSGHSPGPFVPRPTTVWLNTQSTTHKNNAAQFNQC